MKLRGTAAYLGKLSRFARGAISGCMDVVFAGLPNSLSSLRVWYWRKRGYAFARTCRLARDVFFQGTVTIGDYSSIADGCKLNGSRAGIRIGRKVMIAPNCVLVAFDHGYRDLTVPMVDQAWVESPINIEDDVWIGANCTVTKGIRLGRGCIVGANSVVTRDVAPYTIVGGVPARTIGTRRPE